jgi:hypothetical protein
MTLRRTPRRRLCGWMVALLLLMQWLTAAYACPATAVWVQGSAEIALPPCHDTGHREADPANPVLCKAHCEAGQQVTPQTPAHDAGLPSVGWFIVHSAPETLFDAAPAPSWRAVPQAAAPPGWPPLHLTLQVLRN